MSDRGRGRGRGGPAPPSRGGPPGRGGGGGHRGAGGGGFRGGPPRGGAPTGSVIFKENTLPRIPDHLSSANQGKLVAVLQKIPKTLKRPTRPGFGTAGTPITLRSNFFGLTTGLAKLYDYSIQIEPKDFLKKKKGRLFELIEESPQIRPYRAGVAHDHSERLVSAKRIPDMTITIPFFENGQNGPPPNADVYKVSITFVRELVMEDMKRYLDANASSRNYDPLPVISALNLILQDMPQRLGSKIGQNKYYFEPPPQERIRLGMGIEAWRGYFMSVRPTFKQLMVNVNVTMAPFVEPGNLAQVLQAFQGNARGMPTIPKQLAKSIKIATTHLGYKRRWKLADIGPRSARDTTFPCEEYKTKAMSVEAYFKRKYGVTLRHPTDLPVINVGTPKRPTWLPAEICEIEPGNPYRGRLTDREVASMMKVACNPPATNARFITDDGFGKLKLSDPHLDEFKLSVDLDMAGVPARQLPAPSITYANNNRVQPRAGSWNITQAKFIRGTKVASWWIFLVNDETSNRRVDKMKEVQPMVLGFANKLTAAGVTMPAGRPRLVETVMMPVAGRDPGRVQAQAGIKANLEAALSASGQKPSFVLVLLSIRDNFIYPGIKRICDMELGIPTVCMQLEKALVDDVNKLDQYFSNIALKVNTKLGGINHTLEAAQMKWLNEVPTMIIGIDVTHPSPGSRWGSPSIAAVVASVDKEFVQYPGSLRMQRPDESKMSKEVVDELDVMVRERLQLFYAKNRAYPKRILVYRDGVSEGQYDIVIREELTKIQEAARTLKCNPKVTIIICGKRHHARFYPTTSNNAEKNGNTRPGTVVDKGVTGVFDFDFYLQAHAGIKGTVKPTHYNVIYDENNMGADEIQVGTHNASYVYARATKAVSLIPAAYYADLACERGRIYLNRLMVDDETTTAGGRGTRIEEAEQTWRAAERIWGNGIHEEMKNTMFYI